MNEPSSDFQSGQKRMLDYLILGDASVAHREDTPAAPTQLPDRMDTVLKLRSQHETLLKILFANPRLLEEVQFQAYESVKERYIEFLLNGKYQPTWLRPNTRKVFCDLETFHLPNDAEMQQLYPTGSTNYFSKQRVGTCVTIDDEGDVKYWDEELINPLRQYLLEYDEVVSFNGLRFDNYVLSGYSKNAEETQELVNRSFDLMLFREQVDGHRSSLDQLGKKRLGRGKLDRSKKSKHVPETLRSQNAEEISWVWKYCYWDVLNLKDLYHDAGINFEKRIQFYTSLLSYTDEKVQSAAGKISKSEREIIIPTPAQRLRLRKRETGERDEIIANSEVFLDEVRAYSIANQDKVLALIEALIGQRLENHCGPSWLRSNVEVKELLVSQIIRIMDEVFLQIKMPVDYPKMPLELEGLRVNLHVLAEAIASQVLSPDRMIKITKLVNLLPFIPIDCVTRTNFAELEQKIIEEKSACAIRGANGKICIVAKQVQKGSFTKWQSRLSEPIEFVFSNNYTQPSLAQLEEQQTIKIRRLSKEALTENEVVDEFEVSGSPSQFIEFLKEEITKHVPEIIQKLRLLKVEDARRRVNEVLQNLESIILPEGINEAPDWFERILNQKREMEYASRFIDLVEGRINFDDFCTYSEKRSRERGELDII